MTDAPHFRPDGYTTITPFLVVSPARDAIDFYREVFGASVIDITDGPAGTVAHAELDFGTGRLQLSDPAPSFSLVPPDGTTAVNHSYAIYVPDVDAVFAKAVEHGAKGFEEPSTFVTGDRFGAVLDPFGHRWAILTRVEDVDPVEAKRRVDEWVEQNS
ncbi:VOC family protein [Tsukamurella sp. 8F]|uniref:VOC family protein n=1 Tax=unclassified Tsukamurella TaxID=2633480 RepID=UPI0023B96B2A|nr:MULTISPECIES: VOC family protein [unclassified Tsukamurella]MDF0532211.1 VOC family protein [Tsukamurella sp. 8J]MDF0588084.1 VOC family protein [Tsukamurella sp. 8F]